MDPESEETTGGTELPRGFAEHAAELTGLDTPPATLEEWWRAVANQYEENDLTVGFADLYSEAPTRHEVQVNGRVRYANCVMDALMAAMMEEPATATVRSIDPVAATPVTIAISDNAVEVSPEGALICFGMDLDPEDIEAVGSLAEWSVQDDKDEIRDSVCQYTNAFESEDTYAQWASVTDSVAAPLPPADVVPLLRKVPHERTPIQPEAPRRSDSERGTVYRGPDIPAPLGERLALALGLDNRPETFADWVNALFQIADRDDIDVDLDMLCTLEDSPHRAQFNGKTQHYHCVQDPVIAPFLSSEIDTVEIETSSPVSDEAIELTVTETSIDAEPSDAVFSFGVDATVEGPPEDVASPVVAYGLFCSYGHAFPSYEEYEEWAETVDAITMATSMEDTLELARAIGRAAR